MDTTKLFKLTENTFEIKQFADLERGLAPGEISIERLLVNFPERYELLQNVIRTLDEPSFHGRIITNRYMASNVGGYYNTDGNIAINPHILLFGTEIDIAKVLAHEYLHPELAAMNGRASDESVTQLLTRQKMKMVYGTEDVESGYDDLVAELIQYFGDMPYDLLLEMMQANDQETLDKVVDLMAVRPNAQTFNIENLTWQGLQQQLTDVWPQLLRLFPRLVNSFQQNGAGVHDAATMSANDYDLEKLQRRAIEHFTSNSELLEQVLLSTIQNGEIHTGQDLTSALFKMGYGYIIDLATPEILTQISEFVSQNLEENLAA